MLKRYLGLSPPDARTASATAIRLPSGENKDQIVILSGLESDATKVIALIPLQEGQALNVSWNPTVKATLKRDVTMTLHKGHIASKK